MAAATRQVPTLTTVRTASARTGGRVSSTWTTATALQNRYAQDRRWYQFCAVTAVIGVTLAVLLVARFPLIMWAIIALYAALVLAAWRQLHTELAEVRDAEVAQAVALEQARRQQVLDQGGFSALAPPPDGLSWWAPRGWACRNLLGPLLTTLLGTVAVVWEVRLLTSLAALLGIMYVLITMEGDAPAPSQWGEERLREAFLAAGAIKSPLAGRLGTPHPDEHGESVVLKLAAGEVWTDFANRQQYIASALDVDEDLITIEHAGGPPNQVRMHIAERQEAAVTREVVTSPLCLAERTDARQPVRIGQDRVTGEPVLLHTAEHNTLVAGVPGFGKTVTVRMPLGHYLLDPTADVYGLDGKGSRRDYGPVEPLCKQWVWGTKDDADEQALHMLRTFLGIIRHRNDHDHDDAAWTPALLLLEEFQDVRAGAPKAVREEMDTTLGRILRMGRAVNAHALISTQRPSVEDLPSGSRNLIDQRVVLVVRNPADAALALGHTPPKHLPPATARGEAVYADAATDRAVQMDFIDGAEWKALCARAALLRQPAEPVRERIDVVKAAPVTLLSEATKALHDGPLLAVDLYDRLPASVRPATSSAMGKALGRYPQLVSRRTSRGSMWALSAATQTVDLTSEPAPARSDAGPSGLPSLVKADAVSQR